MKEIIPAAGLLAALGIAGAVVAVTRGDGGEEPGPDRITAVRMECVTAIGPCADSTPWQVVRVRRPDGILYEVSVPAERVVLLGEVWTEGSPALRVGD